jgi:aminoglycoside 2''-phosphotransferase
MRANVIANEIAKLLQRIQQAYPDLAIEQGTVQLTNGQFNKVLLVDPDWVFRFPRSPRAASILQTETTILQALQDRLPLPIPDPTHLAWDEPRHQLAFTGYRFIPGVPLTRTVLATASKEASRRLAMQLAGFLQALHHVPIDDLPLTLPVADGRDAWEQMYQRLQIDVFASLRPDARDAVSQHFEAFLGEPANFTYRPVLRHGDFGGTNILFDAVHHVANGVIDFGAAGLGDPAVDLAALSWYGEAFLQQVFVAYPELADPAVQTRANFYRSTHALQQALWALETGDEAEFADGIARYV